MMSANGLAGRIASHATDERIGSDPLFKGVSLIFTSTGSRRLAVNGRTRAQLRSDRVYCVNSRDRGTPVQGILVRDGYPSGAVQKRLDLRATSGTMHTSKEAASPHLSPPTLTL